MFTRSFVTVTTVTLALLWVHAASAQDSFARSFENESNQYGFSCCHCRVVDYKRSSGGGVAMSVNGKWVSIPSFALKQSLRLSGKKAVLCGETSTDGSVFAAHCGFVPALFAQK